MVSHLWIFKKSVRCTYFPLDYWNPLIIRREHITVQPEWKDECMRTSSGLVEALKLTCNLEVSIRIPLDGRNLINMGIISEDSIPSDDLDEDSISKTRLVA